MLYGLLCIIITALFIKLYLFKKSVREISDAFADRLKNDTNTLIGVSSRDKDIRWLAESINTQLKILRKEHHRYTQGDKELKNAVTNISHDLRTPLTAICGYLDVMKHIEITENIRQYLDIIGGRAESMKQLTEELFRYSVIMSEDASKSTEIVFVNQLLEESISGFYAALSKCGITPKINITDQKIYRNLNKAYLSRVFSNLLSNAIKYSDGDLDITLSESGEIIFANTSTSLTAVQAEKLFDRFYTVESAEHSTGLGLSIARTLVEQMDGQISAEYKNGVLYIRITFPE